MKRLVENVDRVRRRFYPLLIASLFFLVIILFVSVIRTSLFTEVDEHKRIWFDITFLLFSAVLAEYLVFRLRQPTVLALMLVGVLISPSVVEMAWPHASTLFQYTTGLALPEEAPHFVEPDGVASIFGQLGAFILLFKVGLHSELKHIFTWKNMVVAILGVVVPFTVGYYFATGTADLFGIAAGNDFGFSLFMAAAFTATSVGVTVAVLEEFGVMHTNFSRLILGAAIIDDILALLVLSAVTNFPAAGTAITAEALEPLATTFFYALVFVIGGILLGKHISINYFTRPYGESVISQTTFLGVLVFLLLYTYVAEFIGLSGIIGAFIAGVTLNYSKISEDIEALLVPLEILFTPIFFLTLGMLIDINAVITFIVPIIAVSIIAVLAKLLGCGLGALVSGSKPIDAVIVGMGMVPRGEIALIIALFGLTAGIITSAQYSVISAMAFLTTMVVPPILKWLISKREVVSENVVSTV